MQIKVSELALSKEYILPEKIKDKEIRQMAEQNVEYRAKLVEKLGYDPLDYSWVEKELAENHLEKKWFQFQREEGGNFQNWDEATKRFNNSYHVNIDIETAYTMCIKWKRYLMGAWNTIAAQNPNMEDWKNAARKFEERHRLRQQRMELWSEEHKDNFPLVKVKKPIRFRHGPHFKKCIEKIPKLFVDYLCYEIREGVILQVISHDPETQFIQLDFTPDIRKLVKSDEINYRPWKRMKADYDFDVYPEEINDHLEFLSPLDAENSDSMSTQ